MNVISIKIAEYTDVFNEYDYNQISKRRLSEDLDIFLQQELMDTDEEKEVLLIIHMPKSKEDIVTENEIKKAINYYYKERLDFKNKVRVLGIKRIFYYIAVALILFSLWYYIQNNIGDNIFTATLNIGATVVLWQMMTLIFIERKNAKIDTNLTKTLYKMNIEFRYIEQKNEDTLQ